MATGRPSKWDELDMPSKLPFVEGWARNGATMAQIAEYLGVGESTLYEWQNRYPEFKESLKINRDLADIMVENALFRDAIGYEYEEEVVTNKGEIVTVTKKHLGNPASRFFWLKNRKQNEWRDKQQLEHSGSMEVTGNVSVSLKHMSDEELAEAYKKMKGDGE